MTHRRTSAKNQAKKLAERKQIEKNRAEAEKQAKIQQLQDSMPLQAPLRLSQAKLQAMAQAHSKALHLLQQEHRPQTGLCDLSRQLKAFMSYPTGSQFTYLDLFQLKRRLLRARDTLIGWKSFPGLLTQVATVNALKSSEALDNLPLIPIPLMSQNTTLQLLPPVEDNSLPLSNLQTAENQFLDAIEIQQNWLFEFKNLMATLSSINTKAFNPPLTSMTPKAPKKQRPTQQAAS